MQRNNPALFDSRRVKELIQQPQAQCQLELHQHEQAAAGAIHSKSRRNLSSVIPIQHNEYEEKQNEKTRAYPAEVGKSQQQVDFRDPSTQRVRLFPDPSYHDPYFQERREGASRQPAGNQSYEKDYRQTHSKRGFGGSFLSSVGAAGKASYFEKQEHKHITKGGMSFQRSRQGFGNLSEWENHTV